MKYLGGFPLKIWGIHTLATYCCDVVRRECHERWVERLVLFVMMKNVGFTVDDSVLLSPSLALNPASDRFTILHNQKQICAPMSLIPSTKVSIVSFYATQQLNQEDYNKPEGSYNHTCFNYLILLSCLCTGKTVIHLRPSWAITIVIKSDRRYKIMAEVDYSPPHAVIQTVTHRRNLICSGLEYHITYVLKKHNDL